MPTRAQADASLLVRVGSLYARASIATTGSSPLAIFNDALVEGFLACGLTPDDVTTLTDADLAQLPAGFSWLKLLDIAQLRCMVTALAAVPGGSSMVRWEDYESQTSTGNVAAAVASWAAYVRNRWGYGAASLGMGAINLSPPRTCREL